MALMFLRRTMILNHPFQQKTRRALSSIINQTETARFPTSSYHDRRSFHPSSLFSSCIGDESKDYTIEIVDDETWKVSTGFAELWKDTTITAAAAPSLVNNSSHSQVVHSESPNFDEIDDLRIWGNLFYKLDKDSKEFEECNFDFHRKKSSKNRDYRPKETLNSNFRKDEIMECKIKENPRKFDETDKLEGSFNGKKQRAPTFNQLTGPYHEPFCLDIYISKASVRACIVHRATSNVVAVAHSISKDMKFDLGSTKNAAACAAVGKVLAQRALADDIHNVVYTPRKGEKLEGKLQNVLRSLIENGVNVKVKIKHKKVGKASFHPGAYKHN